MFYMGKVATSSILIATSKTYIGDIYIFFFYVFLILSVPASFLLKTVAPDSLGLHVWLVAVKYMTIIC
jgi:hypothetical protein